MQVKRAASQGNAVLLLLLCATTIAQEKVIRLCPSPAPGSESWTHPEQENSTGFGSMNP